MILTECRSLRVEMPPEQDDIQSLLDRWCDWMNSPENLADGYPSEASGGFVPSWIKDSEEGAAAADATTVEKVDACYSSLKMRYQEAINRHYGLGVRVWMFGSPVTFEDAKEEIRVFFVRKGLL